MRETIYSESDTWPWWTWVIFLSAMGAAAWSVAGDSLTTTDGLGGFSVGEMAGVVGLLLGAPLVVWALFGKLTIGVLPSEIRIAFGSLGLFRKSVPMERIRRVEAVRYKPLTEFGGWGIRVRPGRRAWTVRGNQAARITLEEGPTLYLGSRNPQRLRERIEVALARGGWVSAGPGRVSASEPE